MLAIFNSTVATGPEELRTPGDKSPSPRKNALNLLQSFLDELPRAISVNVEGMCSMAYTHDKEDMLRPRSFAVKDEIFCLFEGTLQNLPSLRQQYGLSKSVNEVLLVIEAYKTLRDRAPYPASHVVGHLEGQFAFIIFDKSSKRIFVATDSNGKVSFYWGITADGHLAFADDAGLLQGACGKSLASFPTGCFFLSGGGLRSYEHPKNKMMAVPAMEEEICGTTFKVDRENVYAGII
uniref:TSA: Wollemia nobilis Ref_Wollemi_Transcript_21829_1443 transcribed RNA sequence n=1 Tax=Wollemia nobilis TaxID=56998 RepID=A0A0C9S544_9CONI